MTEATTDLLSRISKSDEQVRQLRMAEEENLRLREELNSARRTITDLSTPSLLIPPGAYWKNRLYDLERDRILRGDPYYLPEDFVREQNLVDDNWLLQRRVAELDAANRDLRLNPTPNEDLLSKNR